MGRLTAASRPALTSRAPLTRRIARYSAGAQRAERLRSRGSNPDSSRTQRIADPASNSNGNAINSRLT